MYSILLHYTLWTTCVGSTLTRYCEMGEPRMSGIVQCTRIECMATCVCMRVFVEVGAERAYMGERNGGALERQHR